MKKLTIILFALCALTHPLFGAAKLRLSDASIGPVDIAVGQNGPRQTIEAYNAGDGALGLTVSSPHSWLVPTVGNPAGCSNGQGACTPIRVDLQTAGLARGIHAGMLTIADPDAWDAPQSVTVRVQIGGGVPDEAVLWVPPGGADDIQFRTTSPLSAGAGTQTGGDWLSLAAEGAGTFRFSTSYRVAVRDPGSLAEGTYQGEVDVTASGFAPDVKEVPVTMHVTSGPIGELSASDIGFDLVAGGLDSRQFVSVSNRGLAALSIAGLSTETDDGGEWLTAEIVSGLVQVTADPSGVLPGLHRGTVRIESDAANSPHLLPVRLNAVDQGPPVASFQGVVNNATFSAADPVPQGGIAAVFGAQLTGLAPASGTQLPLVTELGGARVTVNGIDAPLFYASDGQINFQMPLEVSPGEARVQVVRDGQPGNTVTVQVAERSPRLLRFLGNYAIAVNTDGTFAIPPTAGIDSRRARPGDVLVMYAIGFGRTVPAVPTGAAAPLGTLSHVSPTPSILLGGGFLPLRLAPSFVGLTPRFVGLYQINFTIPANAPRGDHVPLIVEGLGYATNQVEIAIE